MIVQIVDPPAMAKEVAARPLYHRKEGIAASFVFILFYCGFLRCCCCRRPAPLVYSARIASNAHGFVQASTKGIQNYHRQQWAPSAHVLSYHIVLYDKLGKGLLVTGTARSEVLDSLLRALEGVHRAHYSYRIAT